MSKKKDIIDKNELSLTNKIFREYNLDNLSIINKEEKVVALLTIQTLKFEKENLPNKGGYFGNVDSVEMVGKILEEGNAVML